MHLKVRPNLNHFLETLRVKFNLHIYTMGSRLYADRVAKLIDPDNRFFGGRITSREDFPEGNCNQKNIQRLFPCDDSMALIVDDREDVWLSDSTQPYMPNLLRAQPYHFWVGMHEAYDRVAPPEHHNPTAHQLADKPSGGSTDNTQQPPAVQGTLTTNSDNTTTIGNGNDISNHRHANLDSPANDSPFQPTGLKVQQPEEADARHAEGGMESPNYSNDVAKNSPTAPEDTAITVLSPPQLELRPSQTVGPSEGTVGAATSEPEKQLSATNIHETDRTNAHDHETKESEQENGDTSARSIKPDGHSGEATNVEKFRSIAKGWWETDSSPKSRSHLLRLAQVLEDCHKEFFDRCKSRKAHNGVEAQSAGQQFQSPADVKDILSEFRKKVLAGCVLTFSGLKPRKDAPETVPEWNLALRLGASCSSEFVHGRTTHVITSLKRVPDTQKCMDAMHSGTAYVVTTDWVEDCALNFERQNELAYCESAQQMFDDGEKFRDYVETRREKAAQALRKRGREELDEIYGNEVVGTIPWKKSRVSEEMDVMDDTGLEGTNGTAAVRILSHDEIGEVMEDLFVE
ncbi:unnamed protein product [Chondrus crispus]|uniref:protein-serine/threonine phosphatase n=1 Tax=Chondrus crispus TaxID=2769 RepID=R7QQX4_CHOCR|nr:unnamed protein product [Chondrus crispus]CDF40158.1 unnamed protein product [Chondrus crispus]|eukprot:XP_005710452.1 unnamed protein product [Chondrus crispus]